ncbi:MAG TPA: hypothetical protein VGM29_03985 [Polyangiaceae bacterium]|jgi:hypothetical protein
MRSLLPRLTPILALNALAWASPAQAQGATPGPAPAPDEKITLTTAPLPAQSIEHRSYHVHDGFYLRMSVGFGDFRSSYTDNNRQNANYSGRGNSMSLDLLVGGSPSPGISIGGGLLVDPLFGVDYQRNGLGVGSHGGTSVLVGPFFDGFPDASRGWHLGGLIGVGAQSYQNVNTTGSKSSTARGLGGAAWFGYDFWVAGEWAVGPELRLMGQRSNDTRSGEDVSAWARSFTLGVSGVFN